MPIKNSQYKIGLIILKYAPILMAIIMYIHTILSLNGVNLPVATTVAGSAIIPSIIIIAISNMLQFCYIHKSFTIYSLITDLCINYQNYFGFGVLLYEIQYLIFLVGTLLFMLLFFKISHYHNKCCVINTERLLIT